MKTLYIYRGKSKIGFVCDNGDVYDSSSDLKDENGLLRHHSEYVNTDHTVGYQGGILSKGQYYGLAGWRRVSYQPDPIRVIRMFRLVQGVTIDMIKQDGDITSSMNQLPSDVPNPNHNGNKVIESVQCHPGGTKWDWSHGCITWLNYAVAFDFNTLMAEIKDKEVIKIVLL